MRRARQGGPCYWFGVFVAYVWNGGPVSDRKAGMGHPLWWLGWNEGITLVRDGSGNWSQVANQVDADLTNNYSFVLRGGYRNTLTTAYRNELVAAGYGAYIETV